MKCILVNLRYTKYTVNYESKSVTKRYANFRR